MPEKVDECVESVLNDDSNDINDKSTAYAICNAQFNKADEMPTLVETILFEADIPEKFVTEGTGLSEEDFVPNADVADAAQAAIDFVDDNGLPNPENQREGIARAHQLVDHHEDDEPLEPEFWEEIKNFHARHRAQDNHECDESEVSAEDVEGDHGACFLDPGYFSDHTWGSDAGKEQAERLTSAMSDIKEAADIEQKARFEEGDWVRWQFGEGSSRGQVKDVEDEAGESLSVDGNEREAKKDEPVYKMDVWREEDEELRGQAVKSETELEEADQPAALDQNAIAAKSATVSGDLAPVYAKADPSTLDEETVEQALEADEMILYGKANIEHQDTDGDVLDMETLERSLDRFFESEKAPGIISIGHDDVPVGIPKRSHTLDEDTTIEVDGETYEFEAGETIETHAEDNDGDGRPELWLVADLAKDNDIARRTRLKALSGELNGFSVTVSKGESGVKDEVRALHAVTIGTDEQIKNKGSEFDVAEFKARFGLADDATVEMVAEEIVSVVEEIAK